MQPAKGTLVLTHVERQAPDAVTVTRAVDSDLQVDILDAEGTVLLHFNEGEGTEGTKRLSLEAGSYQLRAYTANWQTTYDASELGDAKFYGRSPFTIVAGQEHRIGLSVPMTNVGVCLVLPQGVGEMFHDIRFTATIGERTMSLTDGQTAYFDYAEGAVLNYTLSMTNADGEVFTQSGQRDAADVAAGTVYTVTYAMAAHAVTVAPC